MRVCVIEDDESENRILCCALEEAGHKVALAYNMNAGLHRLGTDIFHALLLGWPALRASEPGVIGWIKQVYPGLRILIVAGRADEDAARRRVEGLGADGVLIRPFDQRQLIDAMSAD